MAQQQQQQPNSAQTGGNVPLIRPGQIDTLPLNVTPEQKQQYKNALAQLWSTLESAPQGSQVYVEAEAKIRSASIRLMQQVRDRRPASGGPAGGGGQPGGGQQQQRTQQPGAPPPQQQGNQGQGAMAQNMQQQGSQQGQQPQQQQGRQQLSQQAQLELRQIKINLPPQVIAQGEPTMTNYRNEWARKGAMTLLQRDQARARGQALQAQQKSGQNNSPQIMQAMQKCHTDMNEAAARWDAMKKENASYGQQGGNNQQQQMNGMQQQQGQDMSQRTGSMQGMNVAQQQQQQQGDVKMNMDQQQAQTSMSPTQQQGAFQQQNQNNMTQQQPQTTQAQQTPQSATQGQAPQGYPQGNNMSQQMNQQQRLQMNAQQMAQAQHNANQQQQQGTPTSGVPQSATQQQPPQAQQPQQQQRPQPLTHSAAISQASLHRQDSAQQQQSQQQQQPQMPNIPNGLPLNGPPSATNQTPTSGYPQLPQQASSSTKFPIPKTLTLDPRTQNPVPGPPSRPTFATAGMMGQPGIQRAAQFTLEGEGDRVLAKRKLDELVRQVTGSTEGSESSGGLTPEVEEAVLTLADNFVDNVVTSACRLAKLRSSQTLDVRDIQIVLERNYGIRIPGYGLDEVRTVRKFQPTDGWRSKMQAVQAGKVMGGTGGRDT